VFVLFRNPASNKFLYRFYGMLKKISFKINSLVSKHQFFFSKEAFKRTYDSLVETDPIFPGEDITKNEKKEL